MEQVLRLGQRVTLEPVAQEGGVSRFLTRKVGTLAEGGRTR